MTGDEVRQLNTWLQQHPEAWYGWPTFRALEGAHAKARLDRLKQHGCPFAASRWLLMEVDEQIRQIRAQRYSAYCQQVEHIW